MNFNNITIGIVSFKSEKVIFNCLNSIKKIKKIIILDNSNDLRLKKKIKKIYPFVDFILSSKNMGFGHGNNIIISKCKTDYLFLLSPDTVLGKNCELELLKAIKKLKKKFSIIAPSAGNKNLSFKKSKLNKSILLTEVEYVKGFAMLLNKINIKKIGKFDEKIFLYLEEIDLCKRLKDNSQKIFICNNAEIKHLGAKSSDIGSEYDKVRNWHWIWSKFYFNKKHHGYLIAIISGLPTFISALSKFSIYFFINKKKSDTYYYRMFGFVSALIGRNSFLRPNLNN